MNRMRSRAKVSLLSAICLVAAGCMVGPAYHRPAPVISDAFKEQPPDGWKTASPNDAVVRGAWWSVYGDPELDRLESQVSISNQNVLAALARYREARDQARIAHAALAPTVTTAPSVTSSRTSGTFSRAGTTNNVSVTGVTVTDYTLPVDVSYQADVWGSIRRSASAAAATAQASAADLENARLAYQSQLAELYFELHGLDSEADLLLRTQVLYEQSLQLAKDRLAAGVASGADVAQAEAQLDTDRAQLIDVGVVRAQDEHAIAVLMGEPPSSFTLQPALLVGAPPPVPIGVPSALLERRPDISSAERTVAAANAQIGVAKAALFPSLTLSASGGFESSSLAKWVTWPSRFWSVGPELAATLFDNGRRRAQIDLQQAAYDASVAAYRQTVLTALQQIEDQLAALRILDQEAQVQTEAVAAAAQALDIANAQYQAGTVDYLQVITSQTTAFQAQRSAVDILTRRLTASVLLIEALGGGWDTSQLPAH